MDGNSFNRYISPQNTQSFFSSQAPTRGGYPQPNNSIYNPYDVYAHPQPTVNQLPFEKVTAQTKEDMDSQLAKKEMERKYADMMHRPNQYINAPPIFQPTNSIPKPTHLPIIQETFQGFPQQGQTAGADGQFYGGQVTPGTTTVLQHPPDIVRQRTDVWRQNNNLDPNMPAKYYGTLGIQPYTTTDTQLAIHSQPVKGLPFVEDSHNLGTYFKPNKARDEAKHPSDFGSSTETHSIMIDSRDRDFILYPNSNIYTIYFGAHPQDDTFPHHFKSSVGTSPLKNVVSIELKAAAIPRMETNVNDGNNIIDFAEITDDILSVNIFGGNNVVIVNTNFDHGLSIGDTFYLNIGASGFLGGVPINDINLRTHSIRTILNNNTFTFPVPINATYYAENLQGTTTLLGGPSYSAELNIGQYEIGSQTDCIPFTWIQGDPYAITRSNGSFSQEGFKTGDSITIYNTNTAGPHDSDTYEVISINSATEMDVIPINNPAFVAGLSDDIIIISGVLAETKLRIQDAKRTLVPISNSRYVALKTKSTSNVSGFDRIEINKTEVCVSNYDQFALLFMSGPHANLSARYLLGFSKDDHFSDAVVPVSICGDNDYTPYTDPDYIILEMFETDEHRLESTDDGTDRAFAVLYFDNVPRGGILKPMKGADFDRKILYYNPYLAEMSKLHIRWKKYGNLMYNFWNRPHSLLFEIVTSEVSFMP